MNGSDLNTGQRYFCQTKDKVEGPFDLIELAGLLRESAIDGDTPVREKASETWSPLRERPEYSSLQEIPIETIARHILGKERAQTSGQTSGGSAFPLAWVIVAGVLMLAGVGLWFQPRVLTNLPIPGIKPAEPLITWQEINLGRFSVESPTALEPIKGSNPEVADFQGFNGAAAFGVEMVYSPGATDADYERALDEMKKDFPYKLQKMSRIGIFNVLSEERINGDGYQGWELHCETTVDGKVVESSQLRFVYGKGSLGTIWVLAKAGKFKPEDMLRYVASLRLR